MKKLIIVVSIIIVVAIAIIIGLLFTTDSNISGNNSIVGSWSYKYKGVTHTYVFNEDNTGTYEVSGSVMRFTYVDNGDSISIEYLGDTIPKQLEYSIKGKKLHIKTTVGKENVYTRNK